MAASRAGKFAERRRPGRPRNGDSKTCVKCWGTLEFNERYRFEGQIVPAWVCDNASCRVREVVRATAETPIDASRRLLRQSSQVQASAKRTMLKARARNDNSRKRVTRSQTRIKGKAS